MTISGERILPDDMNKSHNLAPGWDRVDRSVKIWWGPGLPPARSLSPPSSDWTGLWLQEMKPIVMRKRTELIHSDHEETLLWWSIHFTCCCRHVHGTQTKAVLTLLVAQSKVNNSLKKIILIGIEIHWRNSHWKSCKWLYAVKVLLLDLHWSEFARRIIRQWNSLRKGD